MIKYIEELQAIADEVDKFHKGAAIANVTGASVSAAGGIVAIVGLALAPFTLGTSLILSAVGTGVAVAGAATKVTSGVSEAVSNKIDLKKVEEILKSCSEDIGTVSAALGDYVKFIMSMHSKEDQENLQKELKSTWLEFFSAEVSGVDAGDELKNDTLLPIKDVLKSVMMLITSLLDDIIKAAVAAAARGGAQAAAGVAAKATGILGALFLPFDAYDIYKNASDIHRGAKTDLASRIREITDKIHSIVKARSSGN